MFVYKKLKPSDVSITPFEAHKQYTYDSSSAGSNGITFRTAQWTSESKAHYSADNLAGNFLNHRDYFQLDKVFYRDYIIDNANLIPDVNYIKQERRLYDKVNILSIPQGLFGNRIQPTTFNLTGSFNDGGTIVEIKDDGEGNIYPTTHTLGESNWPSEKKRVVYIGPVKGFKKKDLNVLPGTGNTLVNRVTSFTQENVYDDSYYINQVDYNRVTFNGDTPLTYINTGTDGHLRLDHDNKYNFGYDEDFNISFYFKPSSVNIAVIERSPGQNPSNYYLIAKSDTKTIIPTPGEGQSEVLSTFISGNLQAIDVPAENRYPFKIYYKHDLKDTGSIFFERSNGSLTSFVSTSLFYSSSIDENIHVSAQKSGSELQLWINGVKIVSGSDIDPVVCKDQPPTNEANLYIGTRGNIDSYLNSNLSQIMIWNEALSETQIQNISESITGTPYIGNIFYDEGFVTITHPSYTDVLQQYKANSGQSIKIGSTNGEITVSHSLDSTSPSLSSPLLEANFSIGNNNYNITSINGDNFTTDIPFAILSGSTEGAIVYSYTTASNDFTVNFKNSHLIFEHEYQCSVDEEEYNYTTNISVRKNKSNKSADLADCLTGSIDNSQITLFKPYTTTVGLYDDHYNLLAVGKFAQPVRMSEETDMTFVIRWDS